MKYTITMSCGHEDQIELFGKEKEREKKIAYLQSSGLCKECYKNKMREESQKEGFIFNASVLPYIDNDTGSILLSVWFSGDTMPYKDAIKSLGGYRWSKREAADDWYSSSVPMCWNKIIKLDNLQEEITKAVSIGADNTISDQGLFAMIHYKMALKNQRKWMEKKEEIEGIEKPVIPEILKDCRWNEKIYGKSGNYSIYPNGQKVSITNEQAEEIKDYLRLKDEYKKQVEKIQNL